jgi:hypothetical protein
MVGGSNRSTVAPNIVAPSQRSHTVQESPTFGAAGPCTSSSTTPQPWGSTSSLSSAGGGGVEGLFVAAGGEGGEQDQGAHGVSSARSVPQGDRDSRA